MNKLKFLGRGSGYNVKEGNTSAYLIKNDSLLLIDCGDDVFKKIVEKNLLDGIKNIHIVITHMHSDHVGSLGSFVGYCYWKSKITSNIYFSERENIRKFLVLTGAIEGESFILHHTYHKRIDSLELTLISCLTKHTKTVNAYSYVLQFDKGNDIFYSGDTCKTSIITTSFLAYGNIMYHDACLNDCKGNVHTSLRTLRKIIPKKYRKQVYCMHIDRKNFVKEAEKLGFNVVKVI